MAGDKVLEAQKWVNSTYGAVSGYVRCPENGQTGWSTMYALVIASRARWLYDNSYRLVGRYLYDPPGSTLDKEIKPGELQTIFDQLRDGDVRGHRTSRGVGQAYESNYLSGTAIEIRARAYPLGARDGLYAPELVVVRDILAELDGAVEWGGDFSVPKESHFEIALRPGHPKVKGVARKTASWNAGPGAQGAGTVDAYEAGRRAHARTFARRTAPAGAPGR
ncbi:hypothetical protein OG596_19665 [Streptomyces sp. NBC_01102]|uniref:hypothetical protein n=1 Tax=Streptomyces sp. NBC_01102 TaxID=2903749 RepID=UPI0038693E5B|nr:hypothetical protein OG596_19665 [Streptomyces sp. NBC_01102]